MFRKTAVVVAVLMVIGVGAAEKGVPDGASVYDVFPEPGRSQLVKAYISAVKAQPAVIDRAKRGIVKAKKNEKEAAQAAYEKAKQDAEDLTNKNDPPVIGIYITDWEEKTSNNNREFKVGAVGTAADNRVFIRNISGKTAIVTRACQVGTEKFTQKLAVQGFDMTDWVDDQEATLPGVLWVSGKYTYTTVFGEKVTVPMVEPFDWEKYKKAREKETK